MHLTAQLLAAALAAVPLASSAPLAQANTRRQLTDILETAGDVIGPPLYDLNDELLHPTLNVIDDTVDDIGDIFTRRSEKSSSNSPKRRRRQLTDVLETAGDVIGPPLYDLNDELLHPTIPILADTVGDVLDIFGRSEKSNTENKPRQWDWLPPDRYTEETVGPVIKPIVEGVGEAVGNVGDYLQYGLPGKQKRDDDKKRVVVKG